MDCICKVHLNKVATILNLILFVQEFSLLIWICFIQLLLRVNLRLVWMTLISVPIHQDPPYAYIAQEPSRDFYRIKGPLLQLSPQCDSSHTIQPCGVPILCSSRQKVHERRGGWGGGGAKQTLVPMQVAYPSFDSSPKSFSFC